MRSGYLRRASQWLMMAGALLVAVMPNGSALCLPWFGNMHLHVGLAMHADAPQNVYTVYWHAFGQSDAHSHQEHRHPSEPTRAVGVHDGPTFMPASLPLATALAAPLIPWASTLGAIAILAHLWLRIQEAEPRAGGVEWAPPHRPPRLGTA
jgi:hypothetical protein